MDYVEVVNFNNSSTSFKIIKLKPMFWKGFSVKNSLLRYEELIFNNLPPSFWTSTSKARPFSPQYHKELGHDKTFKTWFKI